MPECWISRRWAFHAESPVTVYCFTGMGAMMETRSLVLSRGRSVDWEYERLYIICVVDGENVCL